MVYFTADTHFNHANIIKFCNRPFNNVLEMNEVLIKNWNNKVRPGDTVYHLGDFAFGEAKYIIEELNGKKILIIGSHEHSTMVYKHLFEKVSPLLEIKMDGTPIILCHYAMRTWSKSHYNSWHLFGHSHGRLEPQGKSWDVGVDNNGFIPLSFEEIRNIMQKRPDNFNIVKDTI